MSTYYRVVCLAHRERSDALSDRAGGIGPYGDSPDTLLPFMLKHCGCSLVVVPEHKHGFSDQSIRDWTSDNMQEMSE